jgi:hypothetical protein
MKMLITKYITIAAVITMMAGLSSQADEPQLKLHGKTLLVCPIRLQEAEKPSNVDGSWQKVEIAEGLGITLERQGMLPSISPPYPKSIWVEENLAEVAKQLHALWGQWKTKTDYTLFARFEGKQVGKQFVVRARALLMDASGQIVWSQDPKEFSKGSNLWPIGLYMELARALTAASDLKESDDQAEPGPLETRMRRKSETDRKPMEQTP